MAMRSLLRGAARRFQVRSYAAPAKEPLKEGEMALTFAAGNKVLTYLFEINGVRNQVTIVKILCHNLIHSHHHVMKISSLLTYFKRDIR